MHELTEQKAKDMNDLLSFILEKNKPHSDGFEILWYQSKIRPELDVDYLYHLYDLMKFYEIKYKREWVYTDKRMFIGANYNTEYFFQQGGYLKVWHDENREEKIKALTEKQLSKNIFQLKYWWVILILSAVISTTVTIIFNKLFNESDSPTFELESTPASINQPV
ncbi:MAG TPA: hypothetical protein PLU07_10430 [Ferruginibacter sp.]|nr:hypothetical protein [Ferruginibacter sp.]